MHVYIYIHIWLMMVNVGYRLVSCKWLVGLYCEIFILRSIFSGGALSTFIHLSLGKAGPFTLENHIHVEALKMQGSPNN